MEYTSINSRNSLIKLKVVVEMCAISRSTIYRLIKDKDRLFPAPVSLTGVRSVAWRLSEIEEWVNSRKPTKPLLSDECK